MMSKSNWLILIAMLFSSTMCFASTTSSLTNEISTYIDDHRIQATKFLEYITNINSQTDNFAGIREVGSEFEKALIALGFKTYWQEMPASIHRAGSLYAIRSGSKGKRILLIGHLDTVFSASAENRFQLLSNHWAKGIGVSDMKGGDVVLLQALQALNAFHLLDNTTIAIALMGDEEHPAHPTDVSRAELIRLAKQSDVVFDFESGPPSLGRRGVSIWELSTSGTQQHSSLIFQPHVGDGAIYEISRILSQFARKFNHVDNLTVNPGIMYGGSEAEYDQAHQSASIKGKFNIVAKTSFASGDLRYLSMQQRLETEEAMKAIVQENFPQTQATITFKDLVDPMTPNERNEALLETLQVIHYNLTQSKLTPLPPKLRGGGDISFIAKYVPAGLVGLGPIGKYEHSVDEIVDLDSIQLASKRVAILIYFLTHGERNNASIRT